jgi:transcriptional regulator with XRE-family HTH domain
MQNLNCKVINLSISQAVKQFRVSRGVSQLELEISTGLSFGSVSRIENSRINPTKETLYKIATALELNEEELIKLFAIDSICIPITSSTPLNFAC